MDETTDQSSYKERVMRISRLLCPDDEAAATVFAIAEHSVSSNAVKKKIRNQTSARNSARKAKGQPVNTVDIDQTQWNGWQFMGQNRLY